MVASLREGPPRTIVAEGEGLGKLRDDYGEERKPRSQSCVRGALWRILIPAPDAEQEMIGRAPYLEDMSTLNASACLLPGRAVAKPPFR
jgi:hypothetical protein